jgi:hypothetical protein
MKKVLVITYYWPPSGGAGVQRWLKFVKYLPSLDWEPIIYTVENGEYPVLDDSLVNDLPSNIKVLKTKVWEPYSLYKRFSGRKRNQKINSSFLNDKKQNKILESISIWIRGNLFIPDARKFWIKPSIKFLDNYVKNNPVDFIISTGPPHSTHLIALGIKKLNRIPWLADFRDPWTNIDFYKELKLSKWADIKHKKLEKNVLYKADIVLTIGNQLKDELQELGAKNVEVIENGYDEEDFKNNNSNSLDSKFTIAHIGSFSPSRNHHILWKVLEEIVIENNDFSNKLQIKLIGNVDYSVDNSIKDFNLEKYVKMFSYLPHNQVISHQKSSRVLLLMVNNTPNSKGIITGKIFEYMASNRPILVIGPEDGDLAKIISATKSGVVCGYDNEEKLKEIILDLFNNKLIFNSNIEKYSRKNLTKNLSIILDNHLNNEKL